MLCVCIQSSKHKYNITRNAGARSLTFTKLHWDSQGISLFVNVAVSCKKATRALSISTFSIRAFLSPWSACAIIWSQLLNHGDFYPGQWRCCTQDHPPSATKWSVHASKHTKNRDLNYKVVDLGLLEHTPSIIIKDSFYRWCKLLIFVPIVFYFIYIRPQWQKDIFMLSWRRAPELLTLRCHLPNKRGGGGVGWGRLSTVIACAGNRGEDKTVSLHSGPERYLWSRSALAFHVACGRQLFLTPTSL